jgi:8-oxo-dGTP diphosphatase
VITDWSNWQPTERATLLFVIREGQILLIRKKRGLGAGKINAPGGRIEAGESPIEAAIRETREELCIEALDPMPHGELHFQFLDGYALHCTVFVSTACTGQAVETDEAAPLWTSIDAIPYHEMWADDRHWLPGVIAGKSFRAYFTFDGEQMLEHAIEWLKISSSDLHIAATSAI